MQEYIEKLHKELHEIMERPVTLGARRKLWCMRILSARCIS